MIDKFAIQELTDLPIEHIAARLGLEVNRHKSLCPFHDDRHPSLTFDTRRNRYRCYVCGAYGRTIDLVMHLQHLTFPEACQWLQGGGVGEWRVESGEIKMEFDASRYERFFEHPWLSAAARSFLFEERQLNPAVIQWCKITSWCDKQGIHWLQTPYYNTEGQLIGIQNRNLDYLANSQNALNFNLSTLNSFPRFRFPRGSCCSIYNLPVINRLQEGEPLFITEGCSDCWAMLSAGHKAIAIPSATLLKPKDVELLSTLSSKLSTHFHIYPDQDEPGENLFLQLRQSLPNLTRHQLPANCKDFSDYYLLQKVKK